MSEVHIIAKGRGWEEAPPEGETWGVNDIILRRDQLSMCYHMHDMEWIKRKEGPALQLIIDKAAKNNIPIMTHKKLDWIPTSVEYPLEDIINKFKSCYFGSSIDYMVAYAIYKEYDIITIYGCNMVIKGEYDHQRPSLHFWLGVAMGMGIKVNIKAGEHSAILKTPDNLMYGYNIPMYKVN